MFFFLGKIYVCPLVAKNLCIVVCGCSTTINFVVAVCIGLHFVMCCRHEVCPGCHGLTLLFAIFCFVSVVNVVQVRWVLWACHFLFRVTFDVNLVVFKCRCGHLKS